MFTRSTWTKKFGESEEQLLLTEGLKVLVIVDDNKACANKNLKNCFRPSFPLPQVYEIRLDNIFITSSYYINKTKCFNTICALIKSRPTNKLKIPIILLQGVDVLNLYEQTSCFQRDNNCEVGISSSNQTIPSEIVTKVFHRVL